MNISKANLIDLKAYEISAGQLGLITSAQASQAGITRSAIVRRAQSGRWQQLRRGIYLLSPKPPTARQRLLASVLIASKQCVASHSTAASLHKFPGFALRDPVEVWSPYSRPTTFPDIVVHRCVSLKDTHLETIELIPCTTIERTVIDLSGKYTLGFGALARLMDHLIMEKQLEIPVLNEVVEDLRAARGRSLERIRILSAERTGVSVGEGTALEQKHLGWIRRAGLPAPVVQHQVSFFGHVYIADMAFPQYKLAIESKSYRYHGARTAFDYDTERDNHFKRAGWEIIHFTSRTRYDEFVNTIRALLPSRDW